MAKWKVKAGAHRENGRFYKKGDIVESDLNLGEMFKEKFEAVAEPTIVYAERPVPVVKPSDEDAPKTAKSGRDWDEDDDKDDKSKGKAGSAHKKGH